MLSARAKLVKSPFMRCASTYSPEKALKKYPIGAKVHGYEIQRVKPVPEFSMTAIELLHSKTGAKHLHIDRDDKNNVFSISFKTNPPNSTGVPHILEHTTLCGSEKYPVRDPFFKMLNRSLSNFMNAMTGHDYTFFPFATTNKTDYDNLTDIYLDSTLRPLLHESDFQQEGWRLENEITEDKESPLVFKGVVYNEMKGQVSNSSYYYYIKFQESIFPSLHNSGGDPKKITDLQYWDLLDFHSANYHPSNSKAFTYGSFPLVSVLQKLNDSFITFGKRSSRNMIKLPISLDEPKAVVVEGPVDPMLAENEQFKSSVTWFAGTPKNTYETFLLKILSNLLMDGHSAPLYQNLIEKGIGTDFSVNSGMDSVTSVNMFTVGLQGLTEENSAKFPSLVQEILVKSAQDGFDEKRVEAILHQLELSKKMDSAEFGMNLLYSVTPAWINDIDPFDLLAFDETISKFKEEFKEKKDKVFTDLIKEYLLDSPSFSFTMRPNPEFQESLIAEEKERLSSKTENLTAEEKELVYSRGLELQKKQNDPEDLSSLPSLQISDIPVKADTFPVEVIPGDVPVYTRSSPKANGLTYFRAIKDITTSVPVDLVPYLPLFTECLTNLGTHSLEMSNLSEEIKLFTGGLSASVSVSSSPFDLSKPLLNFYLSGVSLNKNFDKMLELFTQILSETNFHNEEKLSVLIKSLNSDNLNGIISNGHSFAKSFSSSQFSKKAAYDELLNGIKQVQFLSKLEKWNSDGLLSEKVIPKLVEIQKILVSKGNFRVALTSDKDVLADHERKSSEFILRLPEHSVDSASSEILLSGTSDSVQTFIKVPSQVQFSSLSIPGVPYSDKEGASLQVLSQLLTFKRLHKEIREKGGAYGGGSNYDALNGIFNFYSYRDPDPFKSLETFNSSGAYILENTAELSESVFGQEEAQINDNSISQKDLDQAKLTIFQKIDSPISVREEGMAYFIHGIDDNLRQERRQNILDVGLEDLRNAGEKYLVKGSFKSSCIIGSLAGASESGVKNSWNVLELSETV